MLFRSQRWVGILSAPYSTNAPTLATDGPFSLTLGSAGAAAQPLLLFVESEDAGHDRLTYGIIDTPDQQQLILRHGLGQRQVKLPRAMAMGDELAKIEAFDNDFDGFLSGKGFVRLVKTGKGLYTVLEALTRVTAPLLPMLSEIIWRGLTGERSVHLADFLVANDFPADNDLVTSKIGRASCRERV